VTANDAYATDEDTSLNISAPGVLTNDADVDGNPLTAALVTGPAHGTLTLNANGSFAYTPVANYNGPDSFTYRANDGSADSGVATVSIMVRPVNDAPVAGNDVRHGRGYGTQHPSARGIGNDSDVDGDTLSAILVGAPQHGTLTLRPDGSFLYTPELNYHGADSFTYKANDALADSGVATVSLTVRPINDPPVAVRESYATDEDVTLSIATPGVLLNDSDVDGDSLSAIWVAGPLHGTVSLNSDGSFVYAPAANFNGPDSFTYKANDGVAESAVVTVNLAVRPVNDPPVAVNDAYLTDEDDPHHHRPRRAGQ
jgi:VCBS repeat-containing protein